MRVLLDTDAYSAFMRGHEGVLVHVRKAERVYLSTVVVGELMFGFRNGSRYRRNREALEEFAGNPYVELLTVSWTTAERLGRIVTGLRAKGRSIPTNDIWVAAHAMEAGADLLSFDEHYRHIDGIAWVRPDEA